MLAVGGLLAWAVVARIKTHVRAHQEELTEALRKQGGRLLADLEGRHEILTEALREEAEGLRSEITTLGACVETQCEELKAAQRSEVEGLRNEVAALRALEMERAEVARLRARLVRLEQLYDELRERKPRGLGEGAR